MPLFWGKVFLSPFSSHWAARSLGHRNDLNQLKEKGRVQTKQLVDELNVSIDTIRRDLLELEIKGLLKRTHGGAISAQKVRTLPQSPDIRYQEGSAEQQAIAKEAVSYINKGDTVFIGSASLHYALLKYLPDNHPFTVVTNGLKIADALKGYGNIDIYLIGGKVKSSGTIVDAFAIEFLKGLKIDKCFLVGGGLTVNHGLSTATSEGAVLSRTAAEVSRQTICLSTHDKVGNEAFARILPVNQIDTMITDWQSPKDELQRISNAGVEVIVVNPVEGGA